MTRSGGESDEDDGQADAPEAAEQADARALGERYWRLWRANWRPPFTRDAFEEPKA